MNLFFFIRNDPRFSPLLENLQIFIWYIRSRLPTLIYAIRQSWQNWWPHKEMRVGEGHHINVQKNATYFRLTFSLILYECPATQEHMLNPSHPIQNSLRPWQKVPSQEVYSSLQGQVVQFKALYCSSTPPIFEGKCLLWVSQESKSRSINPRSTPVTSPSSIVSESPTNQYVERSL